MPTRHWLLPSVTNRNVHLSLPARLFRLLLYARQMLVPTSHPIACRDGGPSLRRLFADVPENVVTCPAPTQEAIVLGDDADDEEETEEEEEFDPNKHHLSFLELPKTFDAGGIVWQANMPSNNINQYHGSHQWRMKTSMPLVWMTRDCDISMEFSPYWYFMQTYPTQHIKLVTDLTNIEIKRNNPKTKPVTQQEILKFYGILILMPRLPDLPRRDMWNATPKMQYSCAANLGKTGMSRNRFELIFKHSRFSNQCAIRPYHMSDETYRWMVVDDFVSAINHHHEMNFVRSGVV